MMTPALAHFEQVVAHTRDTNEVLAAFFSVHIDPVGFGCSFLETKKINEWRSVTSRAFYLLVRHHPHLNVASSNMTTRR